MYDSEEVFIDKEGRRIVIRSSAPEEVDAVHEGVRIGFLEFRDWSNDEEEVFILSYASVDGNYRRAGIATEMMRVAAGWDTRILVPGRTWNERREDQLHTTVDGRALVDACMSAGILNEAHYADRDDDGGDE
jgi:hypothetical protein